MYFKILPRRILPRRILPRRILPRRILPRRTLPRRILPSARRCNLAVAGSLASLLLGVLPATAAAAPPPNVDQATQLCRESVGKPAFQACMQARTKAGGGP